MPTTIFSSMITILNDVDIMSGSSRTEDESPPSSESDRSVQITIPEKSKRPSLESVRMSKTGQGSGRNEPPRNMRISTRENAAFKWKVDKSVVGAFEVESSLGLDPKAKLTEHTISTVLENFEECKKIWKAEKLHKSFVEAVNGIPPETGCCGLIKNDEQTIRKMVPLLNEGWATKVTNEHFASKGYKVTCFVWSWSNVTGAANNVKLLIRFHTVNESRRHGLKETDDEL